MRANSSTSSMSRMPTRKSSGATSRNSSFMSRRMGMTPTRRDSLSTTATVCTPGLPASFSLTATSPSPSETTQPSPPTFPMASRTRLRFVISASSEFVSSLAIGVSLPLFVPLMLPASTRLRQTCEPQETYPRSIVRIVTVTVMRRLTSRLPAALLLVALLAAFACTSGKGSSGDKKPDPPKTPLETAQRFLNLWKERKYGDMYDLVSAEARATISKEDFVKRYNAIADEATITGIDYEPGPNVVEDATAIPVEVTISTTFFGDIKQANRVALVQDDAPLPASPQATPET